MNALSAWFASESWARIVEALAHSLWLGAAWSLVLAVVMRFARRPEIRYGACLTCLAALLASTVAAWAILEQPRFRIDAHGAPSMNQPSNPSRFLTTREKEEPASRTPMLSENRELVSRARPWLAMAWCAGALLMVGRGSCQIAGARRLLRSCQPVEDRAILGLLARAQQALRMTHRVMLVGSATLTSPAVMGWLVPTLILPLSLATTLSQDQLRLILLHELAHVRRGDYLAHLAQMLVESLLFFNPAVWWINHHARLEREACCDALASEAGGDRGAYACLLVQVAESMVPATSTVAMAFGGQGEPSSLARRVQRLLRPGRNEPWQISWRSLAGSLASATLLFALLVMATRVTVAAILTHDQRMERIGRLLQDHGESIVPNTTESGLAAAVVDISGRIRQETGQSLPAGLNLTLATATRHGTSFSTLDFQPDGAFKATVPFGRVVVSGRAPGFAPALATMTVVTNQPGLRMELVLTRGFSVNVRAVDSDTGQGISGARIHCQYWLPRISATHFSTEAIQADAKGAARLEHASDLPLVVSLETEDYEMFETRFETLAEGKELILKVRKGGVVAGRVVSKETGLPVVGASIHVLREEGERNASHDWSDPRWQIATSDHQGYFRAGRLCSRAAYGLGVQVEGRESVVWERVIPGSTNLLARLGPELIVQGKVSGNLETLEASNGQRHIRWTVDDPADPQNSRHSRMAPLRVENGVGLFSFTNRVAGLVRIEAGARRVERNVDAPIADWNIEIPDGAPGRKGEEAMATRDIVLRFHSDTGGTPRGAVEVTSMTHSNGPPEYARREVAIDRGEVRLKLPVDTWFEYAPAKATLGFWFEAKTEQRIPAGTKPWILEVPVVPAGVITATAKMPDGEPAADLSFSIRSVKPSHRVKSPHARLQSNDAWSSSDGPRRFISSPLPLDGIYQVIAWRKNGFGVSGPVALTESQPDVPVEIQFPEPVPFEGVLTNLRGEFLAGIEITPGWSLVEGHGFSLKPVVTDAQGRFRIEGATPGPGSYHLEITPRANYRSVRREIALSTRPVAISLQEGLRVAGRIVQEGTTAVIPNAELRAVDLQGRAPMARTKTDAAGRFEFSTLGDEQYSLFIDEARWIRPQNSQVRPGKSTNLTLEVQVEAGGRLKPVPAVK